VSVGGIDVTATAAIAPASIAFPLPPGLPPGIHAVAISVNGVPCLPGPVVTL
jgi:hypothetical protein